jgi:hypothetical protein
MLMASVVTSIVVAVMASIAIMPTVRIVPVTMTFRTIVTRARCVVAARGIVGTRRRIIAAVIARPVVRRVGLLHYIRTGGIVIGPFIDTGSGAQTQQGYQQQSSIHGGLPDR